MTRMSNRQGAVLEWQINLLAVMHKRIPHPTESQRKLLADETRLYVTSMNLIPLTFSCIGFVPGWSLDYYVEQRRKFHQTLVSKGKHLVSWFAFTNINNPRWPYFWLHSTHRVLFSELRYDFNLDSAYHCVFKFAIAISGFRILCSKPNLSTNAVLNKFSFLSSGL